MSEFENRAKGVWDETVGKAKRAFGDATDNDSLRAEGDAQEAQGDAEKLVGKGQNAIKDGIDKL